jgi:hypothetical protein
MELSKKKVSKRALCKRRRSDSHDGKNYFGDRHFIFPVLEHRN